MDTMTDSTTLEQRGFVATPGDIEKIAHRVIDSRNLSDDARSTYLRALIASTQHKLGGRRGKQALTPAEVTQQLEALEAVHKVFFEAVERAVAAAPPQEHERGMTKLALIARRSTFARTAASAVRGYVASGHNLTGVNITKVSKHQLQEAAQSVEKTPRSMSSRSLGKKVSRLVEAIRARSKTPTEAAKLLREAISQLRVELQATRKAVPMTLATKQQPAANQAVVERQEAVAA